MNDDNLKGHGFHERTAKEQREIARRGGIASGKARRQKADMRKLMAMMLKEQVPNQNMTYAERITQSMLTIAGSPRMGSASVRAYQTIAHMMGMDEPEPQTDAIGTDGFIKALKSQTEDTMSEAGDIVEE